MCEPLVVLAVLNITAEDATPYTYAKATMDITGIAQPVSDDHIVSASRLVIGPGDVATIDNEPKFGVEMQIAVLVLSVVSRLTTEVDRPPATATT